MDTRTVTFTAHAEPDAEDLADGVEKQYDISEPLVRAEMTDAQFKFLQICAENSVYEWAARIFERLQKS